LDTKFRGHTVVNVNHHTWYPHRERYLNGAVAFAEALGLALSGRDSALEYIVTRHQGNLRNAVQEVLAGASPLPGIGPIRRQRFNAALSLAHLLAWEQMHDGPIMTSPGACEDFLQQRFMLLRREVFCCLYLDSRNCLLDCVDLFRGTIDGAAVYPREVVAEAIKLGANSVIVAHNHPSGSVQPSSADLRITERLRAALALMDIRLLDHIIVGHGEIYSMAAHSAGAFS